jgi:hypothetical protein
VRCAALWLPLDDVQATFFDLQRELKYGWH